MNFVERKKELVDEYTRNQQILNQLTPRQQQIIGQLNFIDELEKGNEKEAKENEIKPKLPENKKVN